MVKFGQPEHGWLPVMITSGEFILDFDASATLGDTVADLVQTLLLITQQVDASVNWFLEPLEYRFEFRVELAEEVRLTIYELVESSKPELVFSRQASYDDIVLPFWRALQKLNLTDFDGVRWHALPFEKLQKLKTLVKARNTKT